MYILPGISGSGVMITSRNVVYEYFLASTFAFTSNQRHGILFCTSQEAQAPAASPIVPELAHDAVVAVVVEQPQVDCLSLPAWGSKHNIFMMFLGCPVKMHLQVAQAHLK